MTINSTDRETIEMFSETCFQHSKQEWIGPCAVILRGFVLTHEKEIFAALNEITDQAPFRHMVTPNGFTMSVAMTNCGDYGWVSDKKGYRYDFLNPLSGKHWPAMPAIFHDLATSAANVAGFNEFNPDVCLVNCYEPGAKLSLHQDKDEKDFNNPIVSVSLGVTAIFLFGGLKRKDKPVRIPLTHGDVVVWGGEDRLRYHGVMPLKNEQHAVFGNKRINLTFRKAR